MAKTATTIHFITYNTPDELGRRGSACFTTIGVPYGRHGKVSHGTTDPMLVTCKKCLAKMAKEKA